MTTHATLKQNHGERCQKWPKLETALRQNIARLQQTVDQMLAASQAMRSATLADIREAESLWRLAPEKPKAKKLTERRMPN
jgi:hypothetical protein